MQVYKLVGLHLVPIELIIPGFILFLKAISGRVAVSNDVDNLILHVLRIITGDVRV